MTLEKGQAESHDRLISSLIIRARDFQMKKAANASSLFEARAIKIRKFR